MRNSSLVIVSAPSGCGKDTIIDKVCKRLDHVALSVSCTTRKPRQKKDGTFEQDGVDYFFLDRIEFEQKVSSKGFIEYAEDNKGDLYGTPCSYIQELKNAGNDVIILNIENQGATQIKLQDPTAVSIFILPPSAQKLRRRLVDRKSETPEQIEKRMVKGAEQMKAAYAYDYVVLNDDLEAAVEDVIHVICAVRRRTILHKELIDRINTTFDQ